MDCDGLIGMIAPCRDQVEETLNSLSAILDER